MSIKGELEVEVDIKSSGDLFHELFESKMHHLPNITPDKVHTCQLHEGEFGKPGFVISSTYTHDGKKSFIKEQLEAIDKENKLLKFKVIEGDLLNEFKSLIIGVQVIPKGEVTGVRWIVQFEKIHDDGPYPTKIIDFAIATTRDIENHHLND